MIKATLVGSNKDGLTEGHMHNPKSIGKTGETGLLVYNADRFERQLTTKVAINTTYGSQMAQDGTSTATITENINNGGDNAYWTPANLSGGSFDFTSTDSFTGWPVDGTQSIDGTGTNNNSLARIDKGSTLDLTPYLTLRGSIYITAWSSNGTKQVLVGFQDSSNVDVGIKVDIGSYIDVNLTNTTQNFTIPLADMSVEGLTIQSLMIDPVDIGAGQAPNFYLDVLKLQDAGEGIEFMVSPGEGEDYNVTKLSITMEGPYIVANQEGAFGKSGFLNVSSLAQGILLGATSNGSPRAERSLLVKDLRDWMQFPQVSSVFSGTDGTNTWVNFVLDFSNEGGVPLRSDKREALTYRIQDDMSGLTDLKVWASGYTLGD